MAGHLLVNKKISAVWLHDAFGPNRGGWTTNRTIPDRYLYTTREAAEAKGTEILRVDPTAELGVFSVEAARALLGELRIVPSVSVERVAALPLATPAVLF